MNILENFLSRANELIWGAPLLILLVVVGLFLTLRTRALQFRYFFYAHKLAFSRHDDKAKGDISQFEAFMTALAATIGIGSITGVATAVAVGGMGAIVWMWGAALFGMATKYGEAILGIKYRVTDEAKEMCGGPMYYLERGAKLKPLALLFALFGGITAIGTGNMVQANSVAHAVQDLVGVNPIWVGLILMVVVGAALLGGIKSIGKVVSILVPIMGAAYVLLGIGILFYNAPVVPAAIHLIFQSAWKGQAAVGGFAGATVTMAIQYGVSRGVFSSEAGLGSSPIAAAAAKTDTPGRQALISMCSVFITTGVVCTITGLVIAISGVLGDVGPDGKILDGSALALRAFDKLVPYGGLFVTILLIPFAYSTILGWAYYGEKCVEYLFGFRAVKVYRILSTLVVIPGAILSLQVIWGFANMMNGLMAFPNLIALFLLSGVIAKETRAFDRLVRKERAERKRS